MMIVVMIIIIILFLMIARYELAAHIKFHNPSLYHDLVVTGLLLERGEEKTHDDTWLRSKPEYYDSFYEQCNQGQNTSGHHSSSVNNSGGILLLPVQHKQT